VAPVHRAVGDSGRGHLICNQMHRLNPLADRGLYARCKESVSLILQLAEALRREAEHHAERQRRKLLLFIALMQERAEI
jgi:hypothetical protein